LPYAPALTDSAAALASCHAASGGWDAFADRLAQPVHPGLLSIVTPTFQAAATLPCTLASVARLAEAGVPYEHLVIDGGSTDGTLEVIRAAPGVAFWLSAPDSGISEAFNRGITLARGEFVLIVNADDWIDPLAVARRLAVLKDTPAAAFVFSDLHLFDAGGRQVSTIQGDAGYARTIAHRMPAINHPTVIVRRAVYEQVGLFRTDLRLAMDYEWLLRVHRAGGQGIYVPDAPGCMARDGASERRFFAALREVRDSSVRHGLPRVEAWGRYGFRVVKGGMRQLIERLLPPPAALRLRQIFNPDLRTVR
jgi:glycosyltransferase involved in cell wall biosynthesis